MMSLLRLVTLQYLRQHPLRTCLTILGVAFGIAIFVAIRVTNLSTVHAFAETVDAVSGRTQLRRSGAQWTGRCPFRARLCQFGPPISF